MAGEEMRTMDAQPVEDVKKPNTFAALLVAFTIGAGAGGGIGGKIGADVSGDNTTHLDSTAVIVDVRQAIPTPATAEILSSIDRAKDVVAQKIKLDNLYSATTTEIADTAVPVGLAYDTAIVHPVLNTITLADVPAGKLLYVQAGYMDAETKDRTETCSILYPTSLTPDGHVMRVNGQLTFSNQPTPKE